MNDGARGTSSEVSSTGGLVVKQWYVDTFFEEVESLPDPQTPEFDAEVKRIETVTVEHVTEALARVRETLGEQGISVVVVER